MTLIHKLLKKQPSTTSSNTSSGSRSVSRPPGDRSSRSDEAMSSTSVASKQDYVPEASTSASTVEEQQQHQQARQQVPSVSQSANVAPTTTKPEHKQQASHQQNGSTNANSLHPPRHTVPTVALADGTRSVPDRFELCEMDALIDLLSDMLTKVIRHNDRLPLVESQLTRFHSRAPPAISVSDYLRRIVTWTPTEPAALLVLLRYIETVASKLPGFTINSLTVHRFLITGLMLAAKALSDSFMTNVRYAKVGGLTLTEINVLEREMLRALDYCLHSPGQLLAAFYQNLVENHPGYTLLKTDIQDRSSRTTNPDTASQGPSSALSSSTSLPSQVESTDADMHSHQADAQQRSTTTTTASTPEVAALKRKMSSANIIEGSSSLSHGEDTSMSPTRLSTPGQSPRHPAATPSSSSPSSHLDYGQQQASKKARTPLMAAVDPEAQTHHRRMHSHGHHRMAEHR